MQSIDIGSALLDQQNIIGIAKRELVLILAVVSRSSEHYFLEIYLYSMKIQ